MPWGSDVKSPAQAGRCTDATGQGRAKRLGGDRDDQAVAIMKTLERGTLWGSRGSFSIAPRHSFVPVGG